MCSAQVMQSLQLGKQTVMESLQLGKQTVYTICYICADGPDASTYPGKFTDPGISTGPNSQLSGSTVIAAGAAVSVIVLVLAAVCIIVMVVWLR